MSITEAKLAFLDCAEVFDKANGTNQGCRVHVSDYNAAVNLRMRLHQCRHLDRREVRRIYQPEDPMYGSSGWDGLVVRIKEIDDAWWVYVEKRGAGILKIESIDDLPKQEHQTQIEHEPVKLLAAPIARRRV